MRKDIEWMCWSNLMRQRTSTTLDLEQVLADNDGVLLIRQKFNDSTRHGRINGHIDLMEGMSDHVERKVIQETK